MYNPNWIQLLIETKFHIITIQAIRREHIPAYKWFPAIVRSVKQRKTNGEECSRDNQEEKCDYLFLVMTLKLSLH